MMDFTEYKDIWVFIETDGGKAASVGLELLNPAAQLAHKTGQQAVAVILGKDNAAAEQEAAAYGADKILSVEDPAYEHYTTDAFAYGMVKLVEQYKPQVCFLDVEMPGMTGLECAKAIQDTDPRTILVFATAHDDYMAQAFEVYAFDYMVKPFKVERVMKTLERIRQVVGGRAQSQSEETGKLEEHLKTIPARGASSGRIMLHHKEGVNFINQSDILLVQRENRSTVLYATGGRRFETSEALGDVEARLDPKIFFRCHKSYIINLNVIDNITPYGRWTYVVHLVGTTQDALITHEKYEELEKMFS